jgi:hypothetical protein
MPYENPRRRYPPIRHEYGDVTALDENGLLRDGHSLRVPREMMDSKPPPPRAPEVMTIRTSLPWRGPGSLREHFYEDGSPKPRRRTVERDPMGREAATFEEEDDVADAAVRAAFADQATFGAYRPGFRSAGGTMDARDRAYHAMVSDLQTQWMSDAQRQQYLPMVDRRVGARAEHQGNVRCMAAS